jgi:zinc transport system substrate-binding protein
VRLPSLLVICLALAACGSSGAAGGPIKVATTVYPVEFIARAIGGGTVEVDNLTPPGAEPHDVELSSEQVIQVAEADVVVFLGNGFQPAVEESLGETNGATIDALDVIAPLETADGTDAHFWLDPLRLREVTTTIADEFAALDAANADAYDAAAIDLGERLEELDVAFSSGLADCASDEIVTSHEAFAYLTDRYGLTQKGISGLDPETEPSPQRIAELAGFVRANDVTTIFSETLLPAEAAETIARETGADVAVLDPLESAPETGDYFTAMERNLDVLREALGCR